MEGGKKGDLGVAGQRPNCLTIRGVRRRVFPIFNKKGKNNPGHQKKTKTKKTSAIRLKEVRSLTASGNMSLRKKECGNTNRSRDSQREKPNAIGRVNAWGSKRKGQIEKKGRPSMVST